MPDRRTLMLIVTIIGLVLTAASAVVLTGGRSDGVLTLSDVAIPATIPALLLVVFTLMSRHR